MPAIPKSIGRYEILELVGRGGMGVLYRARDATLERDVALKMMLLDFTADQTARERFEREAKAVARLQHRNVVTIHELGESDGTPYIVMEFLAGHDLEALMRGDKPMALIQKLDAAIQLCDGLGYAHEQGIVHRDVKPGNVRVLDDGTVKILDFGIAKFAMTSVTQSGAIMGTPSYMAPEQIAGKSVDGRADLFSAGVLLYELLTGKKPFTGDSPTTVVYQIMNVQPPPVRDDLPDLPEALHEIVDRALQKNPDDRYSRASEMASDLQLVKMMLDLPLNADDPSAPPGTGPLSSAVLHARTIGLGRPSTAVLSTPLRTPTEVRAAEIAATAKAGGNRNVMLGIVGAAAAIAGVSLYLLLRPSSTANVAPATGAVTAAAGTSATGAGPAATADTVFVTSVPAGASITLNGADTGKVTPAQIALGGQRAGAVVLSLKGYEPLTGSLTDADVKAGSKEFKLLRESGPVKLTVSGPYAFELLQGGKVISPSQAQHQLTVQPKGPVVARSQEFILNYTLPIDFGRSQVDAAVPALGTIAVYGPGACSVAIDAQDLGSPPIPPTRIASGAHTVVLKCGDGKTESRRESVPPAGRSTVTFGAQ